MLERVDEALRERFYWERDRRTHEYQSGALRFNSPVAVVVGRDAAEAPGGQVAVLALVNMLARFHRRFRLDVPRVPLAAAVMIPGADLLDACVALALAIDPYCSIEPGDGLGDAACTVGIGVECPRALTWFLGATGFSAVLARTPVAVDPDESSRWGAALAACLGASAVFRSVHDLPVRPCQVSLWELSECVARGPDRAGPISVGSIVLVGAGAVGSALCYWLREFGLDGSISIVDGDRAELHNTNRTIGLVAADAGWPDGPALQKADVAARLVKGTSFPGWYSEWVKSRHVTSPDLIIPVANEQGVREAIQALGRSLLVHASTSSHWTAELHRHIADRDDCMLCRMPSEAAAVFRCSTGSVKTPDSPSTDAALPFLSGAAGLMLAAALRQIEDGRLFEVAQNHWRLFLDLDGPITKASQWRPSDSCRHVLPASVRARVDGGRWSDLK